jgi:hypothetical protein
MTKSLCPRSFEAEALRDGRLGDAEVENFQRHLRQCTTCSREVAELQALGEALRTGAPKRADSDELHVRRERTRLLATFDAALVPPEPRFSARRWLPAGCSALSPRSRSRLGFCWVFGLALPRSSA